MNGLQIENVLRLIDGNIDLTRSEATEYIRGHRAQIAESLANYGSAVIPTTAGPVTLTVDDLQGAAA